MYFYILHPQIKNLQIHAHDMAVENIITIPKTGYQRKNEITVLAQKQFMNSK